MFKFIKVRWLAVNSLFENKIHYYKVRKEIFYGLCGFSVTYHKISDEAIDNLMSHRDPMIFLKHPFLKGIVITKSEYDKNTKVDK